jgi:hypothetical protein
MESAVLWGLLAMWMMPSLTTIALFAIAIAIACRRGRDPYRVGRIRVEKRR